MTGLLDTGSLFQALLTQVTPPATVTDALHVLNELYVEAIEQAPVVVHRSTSTRSGNGPDLWVVSFNLYLYADAGTAWDWANALDATIQQWVEEPRGGRVDGVGGIENLLEEIEAIHPVAQTMDSALPSRFLDHYRGSWTLLVRKFDSP